ncbi:hypothetical protein ES703_75341 [subsurface metagenome]
MPYCTKDDLLKKISENQLVELTDDEGIGSIIDAVITKNISEADGEIDSYCKKRYALPFNPVPEMVNKLSVDITIYNLYSRRQDLTNEVVTKRYDDAIKFLKDIRKGLADIEADPPPAVDSGQVGKYSANERIFTRDKMNDL